MRARAPAATAYPQSGNLSRPSEGPYRKLTWLPAGDDVVFGRLTRFREHVQLFNRFIIIIIYLFIHFAVFVAVAATPLEPRAQYYCTKRTRRA